MAASVRRVVAAVAAVAIVALALAVVAGTPGLAAGVLVAAAVILIPGVAVVLALFPGGGTENLLRSVTAIGMGFAVMIVGGIVVNQVGVPLTAPTWLALVAVAVVVAVVGGVAVALRRRRATTRGRFEPAAVAAAPTLDWHLKPVQIALMLAAVLIVAGSIRIAEAGVADQPVAGFTQLWVLPGSGQTAVQVGIQNDEGTAQTYRLVLVRGTRVLKSWPALRVDQGAAWTVELPIPAGGSGAVEARLYRATDPSVVYRSVTYWVPG